MRACRARRAVPTTQLPQGLAACALDNMQVASMGEKQFPALIEFCLLGGRHAADFAASPASVHAGSAHSER